MALNGIPETVKGVVQVSPVPPGAQRPVGSQISKPPQVPHSSTPSQPSSAEPHSMLRVSHVSASQAQVPSSQKELGRSVQLPQERVPPQPSSQAPHTTARVSQVSGVQEQRPSLQ